MKGEHKHTLYHPGHELPMVLNDVEFRLFSKDLFNQGWTVKLDSPVKPK